jgi:hypothetical protein
MSFSSNLAQCQTIFHHSKKRVFIHSNIYSYLNNICNTNTNNLSTTNNNNDSQHFKKLKIIRFFGYGRRGQRHRLTRRKFKYQNQYWHIETAASHSTSSSCKRTKQHLNSIFEIHNGSVATFWVDRKCILKIIKIEIEIIIYIIIFNAQKNKGQRKKQKTVDKPKIQKSFNFQTNITDR